MISAGTEVYWTPNAANGAPGDRAFFVSTVGASFTILRNRDGVPVECAILNNHRLCPLSQLSKTPPIKKTGERQGVSPPSKPAQSAPKPETRNSKTETPKTETPPRRADAQPLASTETCNVLAIDFLNLLVRAFHAGKPTETHAVRSMFHTVANAIRKLRPAHVVFAMDGGHKLRSELLPEYKAHRPASDPLLTAQKELAETAIRIAGFQAIRVLDWEADDVLATLATRFSDTVIASCDKDLLAMTAQATRCRIYHPWGEGSMMTAEEKIGLPAHQVTDYLALCGDTSDGIPGVVGVGPKTAVALLSDYGSLEAIIVSAKLGNIKGATGQKIATQHAAALTCRRVVELNCRLPLPELEDFSPVALWRQKFQDMRLGSVAAIMETLQGERFGVSHPCPPDKSEALTTRRADALPLAKKNPPVSRETSSATTAKVEQVECGFNGSAEGRLNASGKVHATQETQAPLDAPAQSSGQLVTRSISEPLREGLTHEQRFDGPDGGSIHFWEAGRRCATQRSTENPWKKDAWQYVAWQQGFDSLDLCVDTSADFKSEISNFKSTAGSLFE